MSKKILAIILSMLMVVAVFASCGGDEESTTIKIGLSGPLTGDASVYGKAVNNAAQMAVDEINEAGGLNGIKYELIAKDDAHDASKVSNNYLTMIEDGMQVSLGCVTSNPCLAFAELSLEDNIFFLTPSASNDGVPKEDNAYQMCFADGNQGKVAAEYVNGLGYEKIGIFYKSDDSYSKGIYNQFKGTLDSSIETVEANFTATNETDFAVQISDLKDCEFIFMPIYYQPASLFMTQAKEVMATNTVYYGCDGFDGIESAEGFDITAIPQEVTMLSHFNSKAEDGAAADFIKKYTEKFGADTLNQFGASAYDCIYALHGALELAIENGEEVDASTEPSEMCEILKKIFQDGYTFSGVTGNDITWDKNGYVDKDAVRYVIKEANS